MKKFLLGLMAFATIAIAFTSCKDPDPLKVVKIEIQGSANRVLAVGEEVTLVADVLPADAENPKLNWSSDKTEVVTVNANGKVVAVGEGSAKVTAASTDGSNIAASVNFTVTNADDVIPVESVTVKAVDADGNEITDRTITAGAQGAMQFVATVLPEDATIKTVTWSITDRNGNPTEAASVNDAGLVTGHNAGFITVVATASNDVKGTCNATVVMPEFSAESVSLNENAWEFVIDGVNEPQPFQFIATVLPENAEDKSVTWSFIDENGNSVQSEVASVNNEGLVTPLSSGTARLQVITTVGSHKETADISVVVPVRNVRLYIDEGRNNSLTYNASGGEPGTDPNTGEPILIGQTYSASQRVGLKNNTKALYATLFNGPTTNAWDSTSSDWSRATNQAIVWSSSDEAVATVNANTGLITPQHVTGSKIDPAGNEDASNKYGTTTIRATSVENAEVWAEFILTVVDEANEMKVFDYTNGVKGDEIVFNPGSTNPGAPSTTNPWIEYTVTTTLADTWTTGDFTFSSFNGEVWKFIAETNSPAAPTNGSINWMKDSSYGTNGGNLTNGALILPQHHADWGYDGVTPYAGDQIIRTNGQAGRVRITAQAAAAPTWSAPDNRWVDGGTASGEASIRRDFYFNVLVVPTDIAVNQATADLRVATPDDEAGTTITLTSTVTDKTTPDVLWKIDGANVTSEEIILNAGQPNQTVQTVYSNGIISVNETTGVVKSIAAGTADVYAVSKLDETVSSKNNADVGKQKCTVTVVSGDIAVTGFVIASTGYRSRSVLLDATDTYFKVPTVFLWTPATANNQKLSYTIVTQTPAADNAHADGLVITVAEDGTVTGVGTGTATLEIAPVEANAVSAGLKETITYTISDPIGTITTSKHSQTIELDLTGGNSTFDLGATLTGVTASGKPYTDNTKLLCAAKTLDAKVVTYDKTTGVLTAVNPGTAMIWITARETGAPVFDATASAMAWDWCYVTVKAPADPTAIFGTIEPNTQDEFTKNGLTWTDVIKITTNSPASGTFTGGSTGNTTDPAKIPSWNAETSTYTKAVTSLPWDPSGTAGPVFSGVMNTTAVNAALAGKEEGAYFSWKAIETYGDKLCPAGYRIPTAEDYKNLAASLGINVEGAAATTGIIQGQNTTEFGEAMPTGFGAVANGYISSSAPTGSNQINYWASEEFINNTVTPPTVSGGGRFGITAIAASTNIYPFGYYNKNYGLQLRCVKGTYVAPTEP